MAPDTVSVQDGLNHGRVIEGAGSPGFIFYLLRRFRLGDRHFLNEKRALLVLVTAHTTARDAGRGLDEGTHAPYAAPFGVQGLKKEHLSGGRLEVSTAVFFNGDFAEVVLCGPRQGRGNSERLVKGSGAGCGADA